MNLTQIGCRSLAIVLSAMLCNAPQYIAAQTVRPASQNSESAQDSSSQPQQDTSAQDSQSGSTRPDPSQAPLAPVPSARPSDTNNVPPDAPSEVQRSQQQPAPAPATQMQSTQQTPSVPLGTATAQQGATRGGLASRPAGEAIAPAKQRQVHSMLIRLGLVAAGAVAVGTVVGLTRGTSSTPPGAK
jgi:hypothetical protein